MCYFLEIITFVSKTFFRPFLPGTILFFLFFFCRVENFKGYYRAAQLLELAVGGQIELPRKEEREISKKKKARKIVKRCFIRLLSNK